MAGIAITSIQSSGVKTTFATILDIRWQPDKHIDVRVGFFIDESSFLSGLSPVHIEYVCLDIEQIASDGNIPAQIIAQLVMPGAILDGGMPS